MPVSRHMSFPAALDPSVSRVPFEAGRGIFRTGTAPRHIYFIEEGSVRLIRHGRDGEEVVLHDARPGEFLAEASLGSSRYHCDATATESSVLLRVPRLALEQLLEADPSFARDWIALLAGQLRTLRARVERLSLRSAKERIRHLLLSEGRGPHCELEVDGSLKDLARKLGLTHESLYRTLAAMQREGLIERHGLRLSLTHQPPTV